MNADFILGSMAGAVFALLWVYVVASYLGAKASKPSVTDLVNRAHDSGIIEVEDEPIPFTSFSIDKKRQGFVIRDAQGTDWFTESGYSWRKLPSYEEVGLRESVRLTREVDQFLLRMSLPKGFGSQLEEIIRKRGDRMLFVPKPLNPDLSKTPYR